ncbi:MFS transporter [Scytonema sp. NUACC26]|uniref:MFS transporter n=1 Tax=Scytonema sp. NUACC26 TaxID=3140176 RepID=UPI0038B3D83B
MACFQTRCILKKEAIAASQVGRLAKRFSETTLIRASFVFYAIALFSINFVSHLWLLLIQTAIFGIGFGICSPIILSLVTARAATEYRTTVISVNGAFCNLGRIVEPLLMGVAFSFSGTHGVFYTGVGIAIALGASCTLLIATLVIFPSCIRTQ